jgi:hypothetical protein
MAKRTSRFTGTFYRGLAVLSVALGMAGAVLPLLPTTPFLIVAFWAAARGSPRLQFRLYRHPRFGPPLRAWYRHRALSRRTKTLATVLLATSWLVLAGAGAPPAGLVAAGVFFAVIGIFLWSLKALEQADR